MSTRENHSGQVVVRSEGHTDVWEKDSCKRTTNEGHSTYHHNSGNTTDHFGNIISTGGREGRKS